MAHEPEDKPRRLWRWVLAISLAGNLAVVGIVAGFWARSAQGGPPPRGFDLTLGPIGKALAPQDRRAIARALRRDPQIRGVDRRAIGSDLVDALLATPFSKDALVAALGAPAAVMQTVQNRATEALVDRIVTMTDQERAALADRLQTEISRKRR